MAGMSELKDSSLDALNKRIEKVDALCEEIVKNVTIVERRA